MERTYKCNNLGFSTILWAVAAILLCAAPSLHAQSQTVQYEDEPWFIPSLEHPSPINGDLLVYGTVNLLPGADIIWALLAKNTSTVNITGGTVGDWIDVTGGAKVTAYAVSFTIDHQTVLPSEWDEIVIDGTLRGYDEYGTELFAFLFDCHDGGTVTLATPVTQMLNDLVLYILTEVGSGNIAPEMEVSLLAKIDAALAALDRGNPNDAKVAMNDLKALVNQVEAQTEKKISGEAAEMIISNAIAISDKIGGL